MEFPVVQPPILFPLERQQREQERVFTEQLAEAKGRYEDFDEVIKPAAAALADDPDIPGVVKAMLGDSDVMADLVYVLASKPEEFASFVKMTKTATGKALRYIALTESLIHEERATSKAPKVETPAKPETKAPRPPTEAGGRAAAPPDGLRAALEANDYRAASKEFTRQALAKLKG